MRASYSCDPLLTRGRLVVEEESAHRTCFQRDRDRIIHSSAFRRLKHKTQVFVEHEGDYFRTRLTHSIEVAQVARTMAGALGLNEGLTEAIALAHDLGHTPFGHTGEDALDVLMQPYGGFDHNAQAVKIVTALERHYANFDGLNLTWETLEGLAKHNGPVTGDLPHARSASITHGMIWNCTHTRALRRRLQHFLMILPTTITIYTMVCVRVYIPKMIFEHYPLLVTPLRRWTSFTQG